LAIFFALVRDSTRSRQRANQFN